MKERQRSHNRISTGHVQQRTELRNITENAAVTENHPFGLARRPAGK